MSEKRTCEEVFADTCVLLNFVQQEIENDRAVALIESSEIDLVVSLNVLDELEEVAERRHDMYQDLLDFLIEQDEGIEEYDPSDRRNYIGKNDAGHVRDIQMTLATVGDRRTVLRRLRQFSRAASRRVEYLQSVLEEQTVEPLAPFDLELAIGRLLDHSADARIVTDAAGWSADGGSGILVTIDRDHLIANAEDIVSLLTEKQGPEWIVEIISPEHVAIEGKSRSQAE